MRPRPGFTLRILLLSSVLLLIPGCKGATPIKSLLDDPAQYDGATVKIAGTVTGSVGAIGEGAYQVDDGSGTITVLTRDEGVPRQGAKVGVKGVFRSSYTFKTEVDASSVILEKGRYTQ